MAISAKFTADFSSFQQAVQKAETSLKTFETGAAKVESALNKIGNSLTGNKVQQDAVLLAKSIEQLGGATKLTEKEQAKVNATLTEAIAKYKALGDVAPKAVTDLEAATRKLQTTADGTHKTTSIFGESIDKLGGSGTMGSKALGLLTSTFGQFTLAGVATGLVNKLGGEIVKFIDTGTKLGPVQESFTRLSGAVRQDSHAMLSALTVGTKGMVSNYDLMLSANKSMLLGLPVTAASMGELAKTATTLGKAMGQGATKSLDDLIVALGRSSPLILDNLGLTVKVEEANKNYAASLGKTVEQLTEAEKKTAFYNEAMKKARERTAELGEQNKTLGEVIETVWTQVGNVISKAISVINKEGGRLLSEAAGGIADAATGLANIGRYGVKGALAMGFVNDEMAKIAAAANAGGIKPAAVATEDFTKQAERLKNELSKLTPAQRANIEAGKALGLSNEKIAESLLKMFPTIKITERHLDLLDSTTRAYTKSKKDQTQTDKEIFAGMHKYADMLFETEQRLKKATNALADNIREHTIAKEVISATIPDELTWKWRDWTERVKDNGEQLKILAGIMGGDLKKSTEDGAKYFKKMNAEIEKGLDFGRRLSQSIIGAVQGGGDIGKTVGAHLGNELGEWAGKHLAKTLAKSLGNELGGALGGLLGPLGAIGGQLLGGFFDKLFGKGAGRKAAEDFAAGFGGFNRLQKKLESTFDPATAEKFWRSLTQGVGKNNPQQAKAVIDGITEAMALQQEILGRTVPTYANVTAAAERYGLKVTEIGDSLNSLRVMEVGQQAADDWRLMAKAGADMEQVAAGMADEIQALVIESIKWGHALPESMRPMLEKMQDMGLLTDDTGEKLDNLDEIQWTKPLADSIDGLIAKMSELIDKISGVGGAFRGLPSGIDVNTRSRSGIDVGDNSFANGTGGFRNFRGGTLARLHGWEAVVRPGDTMPGGGDGEHVTNIYLDEDVLVRHVERGLSKQRRNRYKVPAA